MAEDGHGNVGARSFFLARERAAHREGNLERLEQITGRDVDERTARAFPFGDPRQ
jgi:hypothetical protein